MPHISVWAKHPAAATQPTELENPETPVFKLDSLTPLASFKLRLIRVGSAHDTKMKTTGPGKRAIGLNIPGGVMSGDFSEKADCSQRMVFFKSSLAT